MSRTISLYVGPSALVVAAWASLPIALWWRLALAPAAGPQVSDRIFPNDHQSAERPIEVVPAEQNGAWLNRRYLDMDKFHEWAQARRTAAIDNIVVAINH